MLASAGYQVPSTAYRVTSTKTRRNVPTCGRRVQEWLVRSGRLRYAPVRRFEELRAWCEARALCQVLFEESARGTFARDFHLRSQMRRAAISVGANIAEGFDRVRPSEFHYFLTVAKGSWAEVGDAGHLSADRLAELVARCDRVSGLIGALRTAVRRQAPLKD